MFDHHLDHRDDINQFGQNTFFQLPSLNARDDDDDDDDDMALGDEAGAGLLGNMSDDDGNISHSLNVSPTMDDDDDGAPELVDHKPLQTPPLTPTTRPTMISNKIDQRIAYTMNENDNEKEFSSISNGNSYDNNNLPTISNNYSSYKQNSSNSFETNDNFGNRSSQQRSSTINSYDDQISNSNFSSIIQNWLRDFVTLQSNRRLSSFHEKPWSKSARPWALDKLQRDIERFHRLSDYRNAIEASKKMLRNGVLG